MSEQTPVSKKGGSGKNIMKIIVVVFVIAALVAGAKYFDLQQVFRNTLAWIFGLGSIAPVIFIILYILACVL